jgi:16S rRNA (guanine966-N2)-methyltransferase
VRIIAGQLGGRNFASPHAARTHPMSDKIRGALFNVLGDVAGLTVLDPFAGSGALAYEAVSRGADSVLCIENDKSAQRTIRENITVLQLERQIRLISANSSSWSDANPAARFDLMLADPPYDDVQLKLLEKLVRHVAPGGIYVLSWPASMPAPELTLPLQRQKSYGDAQLLFYKTN